MHIMHMHTVDLLAGSRIEERIRVFSGLFFNLSLSTKINRRWSSERGNQSLILRQALCSATLLLALTDDEGDHRIQL